MNILNKISVWLGCAKRVVYTLEEEQLQFACYVGQGCFSGSVALVVRLRLLCMNTAHTKNSLKKNILAQNGFGWITLKLLKVVC